MVTPEQIVDSLFLVADHLYQALLAHDGETANDYKEQIDEINEQYQTMQE